VQYINIKDMIEFCPYAKGSVYRGAQSLSKVVDNQCQTWYVVMFLLNLNIPKGYLINDNYSDRLAQFNNYIYNTW